MESLGAEIEVQCVDADCTGDGIIDLSDWLMLQGALWEQHNPTTTPVARRLAGASENTRRGVPACVPSGLAPAAQWNRVIWRGASRRLGVCGRAAAPPPQILRKSLILDRSRLNRFSHDRRTSHCEVGFLGRGGAAPLHPSAPSEPRDRPVQAGLMSRDSCASAPPPTARPRQPETLGSHAGQRRCRRRNHREYSRARRRTPRRRVERRTGRSGTQTGLRNRRCQRLRRR
jgi:hypothetical protein